MNPSSGHDSDEGFTTTDLADGPWKVAPRIDLGRSPQPVTTVTDAPARIPETELDPNGRYVAVQHWPDGVYLLSAADYAERKRDVHDAGTFRASWWRPEDADRLEPGQLYDRTMDITFGVAKWVAMRAEAAEAGRKRVTLARVERDPVPESPFAVDVIAVTEDGRRHRVTVAGDGRTCAVCGWPSADHNGGLGTPEDAAQRRRNRERFGFMHAQLPDGAGADGRQEKARQLRVKWAARRPHAYRRDPERFSNAIAWHVWARLALDIHKDDPPWLADAYRAWSPESVRLGEAYAAEAVDLETFRCVGARFTWQWWRYHDASWQAWAERAAGEHAERQQQERRERRAAALEETSARRAAARQQMISGEGDAP